MQTAVGGFAYVYQRSMRSNANRSDFTQAFTRVSQICLYLLLIFASISTRVCVCFVIIASYDAIYEIAFSAAENQTLRHFLPSVFFRLMD